MAAKFNFWLVAILVLTTLPIPAAEFSIDPASQKRLLHRVAVFSDDPDTIHDPRHPQPQTGADKMFAPIGLFWTSRPVPHQAGATTTSVRDMGTAFLVSPCLVMTNYHVVFGNRNVEPESGQDFSGTFWVGGRKSHAVPVKYGELYDYEWQDWVLLRLDSDSEHPCAGEDPDIGWVQLTSMSSDDAPNKSLSTAGYPSDKTGISLWRQDTCHLFEALSGTQNRGLWTTDCPTRPRASGSPIFFIEDGTLKVVALMHGHLGNVNGDEILPKWDPSRANLAVDMGRILSSDDDLLRLIDSDIDRYHQTNPAQVVQSDTVQLPQIDDTSGIAPEVSSELPSLSQADSALGP